MLRPKACAEVSPRRSTDGFAIRQHDRTTSTEGNIDGANASPRRDRGIDVSSVAGSNCQRLLVVLENAAPEEEYISQMASLFRKD